MSVECCPVCRRNERKLCHHYKRCAINAELFSCLLYFPFPPQPGYLRTRGVVRASRVTCFTVFLLLDFFLLFLKVDHSVIWDTLNSLWLYGTYLEVYGGDQVLFILDRVAVRYADDGP